jgi:NAD-dependent dihydropyrimidine dehydrogenase PreA subunit
MFPESDCLTGDDCSVDLVDDGKWDEWENDAALLARASRLIRCGDFDEEPVEEEVHDGEGLTPYAMGLVRAIFDAHSGSGGGAVSDFGLCSVSGWVSRCGGEKVGIHHPSVRRTWSLLSGGDGLIGWGSFVSFYEEAARKRPGDVRSDFDKYAAKVEERKLVSSDIWDECDISDVLAGSATATNSFELVPTCEDGLTPLESEQYIFVDEGSCIGCALCAQAAPEVRERDKVTSYDGVVILTFLTSAPFRRSSSRQAPDATGLLDRGHLAPPSPSPSPPAPSTACTPSASTSFGSSSSSASQPSPPASSAMPPYTSRGRRRARPTTKRPSTTRSSTGV